MKLAFLFVSLFFLAKIACADSAADRAAIEQVVQVVLGPEATDESVSALFVSDAESEFGRLRELERPLLRLSKEPWPEVTAPMVAIRSIRFVTPDVALVDAANVQYGSLAVRPRIPVLLVLRKDRTDWRIVSLRVLVDSREIIPK